MWLYPATYLLHIAEELWVGEGFAAWFSRTFGRELTNLRFLVPNCLAWVLLTIGIILIRKGAPLRWLLPAFATAMLANSLSHLIASLWMAAYSPGTYTALLLWVPLGSWTLRHMWTKMTHDKFLIGVAVGVQIHFIVLLALFK